jgi:hypothetical protein
MVDVPTDRDVLEELYAGGGLTRAELNYLLGERPGALSRMLIAEFVATVGALQRGDFHEVDARGFLISAPSHFEAIFLGAKPRLERLVGPVSLAVLSPSPTDVRFALPAVVPRSVSTVKELRYSRFVTVHSTVLNLETLGGAPARFLLVHDLSALPFEDFFAARAPSMTGGEVLALVQDRLNLDFPEVRMALLAHLFSAPPYHGRAGGTGLSLMACEDRHRCLSKKALYDVLKDLRLALPAYMTGRRSSSHLDYQGIRPVPLRFTPQRLHWRFNAEEAKAAAFLTDRSGTEGVGDELSMSTRSLLEVHDFERDLKEMLRRPSHRQVVMSVCDLPVLLAREDLARDEAALELHERSEDIAHAVVHSAQVTPASVLDSGQSVDLVERILREIHRDWPELEACMKRDVMFDLSSKGGLLEHATRATGSLVRACSLGPEDASNGVQDMYVGLFARFYDALEPQLRHYVGVLERRERELRNRLESDFLDALEHAFFVLEATFPDGWPYPELERLVLSRVSVGRAGLKKRFDLIHTEGEVVEVAPGVFRRIKVSELFR